MDNTTDSFSISDEVFTIVAHPLRRKILQALFETKSITFTTLSVEWELVTGTIYHHLKILGSLVYKDEQNIYHLTEEGISVCEWFLNSKSGRSTVKKIDSFTLLTQPLETLIYNNQSLLLLFSIILGITGIIASSKLGVHLMGTFIVPDNNSKSFENLIFWNLLSLIFVTFLLVMSNWVISKKQSKAFDKLITRFLAALIPSNSIITLIWILDFYYQVELTFSIWLIISFLSQGFFLFVVSSTMININAFSIERSALFAIGNLYVQFIFVFLLI